MNRLWGFSRLKRNREILAWIGGGVVTVVAGLWALFVYFFPPKPSADSEKPTAAIKAMSGGIAIGGNVNNSNITLGLPITNVDILSKNGARP